MTSLSKPRQIAGILVLALALCATPAAARQFDLDSNGSLALQTLPNPDQQTPTTSQPATPPIPRPARPADLGALNHARAKAQAAFYKESHMAPLSNADTNAARPAAISAPTVDATNDGFDWGDAAIGAAITAAIALLIAVTNPAVRQRDHLHNQ